MPTVDIGGGTNYIVGHLSAASFFQCLASLQVSRSPSASSASDAPSHDASRGTKVGRLGRTSRYECSGRSWQMNMYTWSMGVMLFHVGSRRMTVKFVNKDVFVILSYA